MTLRRKTSIFLCLAMVTTVFTVMIPIGVSAATEVDAQGPYGTSTDPIYVGEVIAFQAVIIGGDESNYLFRWDVNNDGYYEGPGAAPDYWGAYGESELSYIFTAPYIGLARVEAWDGSTIGGVPAILNDTADVYVIDYVPVDDYMWIQEPDPSGWDVNATWTNIMADDFNCTEWGYVIGVTLWGSWKNGQVGTITNFHLSFHEDIPVNPNAPKPIYYSRPGKKLWEFDTESVFQSEVSYGNQGWYDPSIQAWNINDHYEFYKYEIQIADPDNDEEIWHNGFPQYPGTIYWLDVQVTAVGGVWGWKTATTQIGDDAVWGLWNGDGNPDNIEWHELIDPITNESLDTAYGLINKKMPIRIDDDEYDGHGDIVPYGLNLGSNGLYVSIHFEVPVGFDPITVDISSLALSVVGGNPGGYIPVDWGQATGSKKVLAKFDRSDLEDALVPGINTLVLSGQFENGTPLEGENSIKVIDPGK